MKTFVALLCLCAVRIFAQTDCGNCWPVQGSGCFPSQDPTCDPTRCQICEWFIDCDDHNCAYHIPAYCDCLAGVAMTKPCGLRIPGPKHIVAKQKEKNGEAVKKVAWYRWSPIWNNAKH